jgi:hypothetical protein
MGITIYERMRPGKGPSSGLPGRRWSRLLDCNHSRVPQHAYRSGQIHPQGIGARQVALSMKSPTQGSQYLLRAAVNRRPELLCSALRECGALGGGQVVEWHSPLPGKYQEFRDGAALRALGLENRIKAPLGEFWPSRGPVWDALGTSSDSRPLLVEAKAHIPEAVSRAKASSMASIKLIEKSLALVRKHYTRKSDADWTAPFYQYANRSRIPVLYQCEGHERALDRGGMAWGTAFDSCRTRTAGRVARRGGLSCVPGCEAAW